MSEFVGVAFDVDGNTSLYAIAYHPLTDPLVRKAALTLIHDARTENPTVADTYPFCAVTYHAWVEDVPFGEVISTCEPSIGPLLDIRNMGVKKAETWLELVTVAKENDTMRGES